MAETNTHTVLNYSALAFLYDLLMKDVDYESWADYIDEIIQTHHTDAIDVLEMACGTGSLAISLDELECYRIDASDLSEEMLKVAIEKGRLAGTQVNFFPLSFNHINIEEQYDVVFSVFDSINYLIEKEEISDFLQQSTKIMKADGLLIFDFATPKNSLESEKYLDNNQGEVGHYRFFRKSTFDIKKHLHYNQFEIERLDPNTREVVETFNELHCQRVYTLEEMKALVNDSPYTLLTAYGDFDLDEATNEHARITLVLQWQTPQ